MIRYKKYFALSSKVFKHSNSLWNPLHTNKKVIETDSCFNIDELNNPNYK